MTPEDEARAALEAAFEQLAPEERINALLCTLVGMKAAAHSFEHGDVSIEQVDIELGEDSGQLFAIAHLSDGHAVISSL